MELFAKIVKTLKPLLFSQKASSQMFDRNLNTTVIIILGQCQGGSIVNMQIHSLIQPSHSCEDRCKFEFTYIQMPSYLLFLSLFKVNYPSFDSTKSHALRALVPTIFMCLVLLRFSCLTCLTLFRLLRALLPYAFYVRLRLHGFEKILLLS